MTYNDLVRSVFEGFELPRKQVTEIVAAVFDQIETALISGDAVRVPIGIFKIRDRAARVGRNPQTGEPVKIAAKRVLKFAPGKSLKEAVAKPGRKSTPAKKSPAASKGSAKKTAAKRATVAKRPSSPAGRTTAKRPAGRSRRAK